VSEILATNPAQVCNHCGNPTVIVMGDPDENGNCFFHWECTYCEQVCDPLNLAAQAVDMEPLQ
jgi:hypothetical protein